MMKLAEHTDKLVRGPLVGGGVEDTSAIELEELEALLLSSAAVAIALGQVVQNGGRGETRARCPRRGSCRCRP